MFGVRAFSIKRAFLSNFSQKFSPKFRSVWPYRQSLAHPNWRVCGLIGSQVSGLIGSQVSGLIGSPCNILSFLDGRAAPVIRKFETDLDLKSFCTQLAKDWILRGNCYSKYDVKYLRVDNDILFGCSQSDRSIWIPGSVWITPTYVNHQAQAWGFTTLA